MELQELVSILRKDMPYQWRVQSKSKDKTKAICTAYIDARDVMNVLDENCLWESKYEEIAGFIFCGIGITLNGDTYWRWDCGQRIEENPDDNMYDQAGKSSASDSFKRAAVQWGIGRFLYDLPSVTLPCDGYNVVDDNGKRVWDLTKHINSMNKTSAPQESPDLPQDKLDSMLKFINDGKIKEVELAMKKYKLTTVQKEVLTKMINQHKAEVIKKAASK